jgi:hypothetical protein
MLLTSDGDWQIPVAAFPNKRLPLSWFDLLG